MQRCKAKSKRSGEQRKNYSLKGWGVCRMHGARGGPKTKKGLLACKKAPFKHGLWSYEALQDLREMRAYQKNASKFLIRSQFVLGFQGFAGVKDNSIQ
jgi:hypothetical protein